MEGIEQLLERLTAAVAGWKGRVNAFTVEVEDMEAVLQEVEFLRDRVACLEAEVRDLCD